MRKLMMMLSLVTVMAMVACQESLEDRCAREAKNFTKKNCPVKLSDVVTIDSMVFDKATHTLQYCYTMTMNESDTTFLQHDVWRKTLLRDLKNTTSMKAYLDAGYNVQYIYYSAKDRSKPMFEAKFTEKDYR